MPIWLYALTVGRALSKKNVDSDEFDEFDDDEGVSDSSGAGGKHTPSTGSVDDDFELLDKSLEDVDAAKVTGSQPQAKLGKSGKRKGKKK